MAEIQIWYSDDNDMVIEVSDLTDVLSGSLINDATVQATLQDENGNDVAGQTWPINVPYSSTPGLYQVTVDKAVSVLNGSSYVLTIKASTPSNLDAEWKIKIGGGTRFV